MGGTGPILVVGASGSVGGYLLRTSGPDRPVLGTYLSTPVPGAVRLDAAEPDAVSAVVGEVAPSAVVLCAALAAPDLCEAQPELSHRANVRVPEVLAEVCGTRGIRLVHLSTDYVFDGTAGPYPEDAAPGPLNVYGRDKLRGEQAVLASGPTAAVLRTSVVYGGTRLGALDQVLHHLTRGLPLALSGEHRNTPTDVADLTWLLYRVLDCDAGGVYHAAGPRTMSRFDFGTAVARSCGLQTQLIEPLVAATVAGRAPRPRACGLLIGRAVADFGYRPADLDEGLVRHYPQHLASKRG